ncbi:autotransporter-associated beta strand repeat-containing protein [Haloferula sp. BvORR071]|uniref:beta strand repeat-containing protein n=1 Tax=Haloferula sp. BvORR071 TaxID=1396141 RepID=UPI00054F4035|nr:autotransporter-associated beta strand repeat-containing protein [Haloferula sp. BvORR071]
MLSHADWRDRRTGTAPSDVVFLSLELRALGSARLPPLLNSTHCIMMNIARIKRSSFTRRWLLGGSTALGLFSAHAATVTWTGNGADSNFDTAGNWNPAAPAAADELVFPNTTGVLGVNLNGTFSPAKLTFSSTGFNDYVLDGAGTIAGTGVVLAKTGDSYLGLGGNNSFSGQIQLNAGVMNLTSANLVASTSYALGASGNVLKIASGATFDLAGQGAAVHATAASRRYYSVEVAGKGVELEPGVFAGAITSTSLGNLAYAGRGKTGLQYLLLTADATVNVPNGVSVDLGYGTTTTNGSITSSGATARVLTKTGPGALQLGGTNTTSGGTTGVKIRIAEGSLTANAIAATGDEITVANGASFRTGAAGTFPTPLILEDGALVENYIGGASTLSGDISITGTPVFSATNTTNLTISDSFNAPASINIRRIAASGFVIFTGDNTVAENVYLTSSATLQLGSGGTTGSFKTPLGADAPIDLGSAGALILNRSDSFTYDAPITGTGSIQKSGSGTLTRTVEATFARPGNIVATVSTGTLLINNTTGFGIGDGSVIVNAAATLGGTGSVAGPVLLGTANAATARGFIAPGNGTGAIGTFTIGGLQLASAGSATLQLDVNGTSADKLVVNGDLILGPAKIGEIAILPTGSGATQPSYTLLEYTGTLQGSFNSITGVPAGYRIRHDQANKRILLEQNAGPNILPQILYYDGGTTDIVANGDAAAAATAGNWNTTLLNWDQGTIAHLPWANDGSATAILATGAYAITVDPATPLAVAGIKRFGTTANATLISGGTLALQPGANLHEGFVGTSDQGLRIASKLTGSGGFTVTGRTSSGTNFSRVILANPVPGDNTITGPVTIAAGYLRLAASEQLGNTSTVTANTGVSGSVATLETASSTDETIAGLAFGPNGGELKLGGASPSVLTLDGGGLSIANAATFTYGSSASGIRFANAGEFTKSGDSTVVITRANAANFIDLGDTRNIRVNGDGALSIGVNLVNGALVKQGPGTLILASDANAYQGKTTVAQGTLRMLYPTLYNGSTLDLASGTTLDLGFTAVDTVNLVKTFIVAGVSKPAGLYGPIGASMTGVTELAEITGSGLIQVDPTWTGATPFDLWAQQITDSNKRGKTDDPDNDGFDNFTEFAFDGNPSSGTGLTAKVQTKEFTLGAEKAFVITIPVRAGAGTFTADATGLVSTAIDGVIYRVQGSETLTAWPLPLTEVTGNPGITLPTAPLSSASWEYRSFRINGPTSAHVKAFLRAKATE